MRKLHALVSLCQCAKLSRETITLLESFTIEALCKKSLFTLTCLGATAPQKLCAMIFWAAADPQDDQIS